MWTAPVVLIATALPAAAASTDTPTFTLTATANHAARTIVYTVTVSLAAAQTSSYINNGFTITVGLPVTGGTIGSVNAGWSETGNVFTRTGGTVTAPGTAQLAFTVTWATSSGLAGSTTTFSLAGTSGGGAVSGSTSAVAA